MQTCRRARPAVRQCPHERTRRCDIGSWTTILMRRPPLLTGGRLLSSVGPRSSEARRPGGLALSRWPPPGSSKRLAAAVRQRRRERSGAVVTHGSRLVSWRISRWSRCDLQLSGWSIRGRCRFMFVTCRSGWSIAGISEGTTSCSFGSTRLRSTMVQIEDPCGSLRIDARRRPRTLSAWTTSELGTGGRTS